MEHGRYFPKWLERFCEWFISQPFLIKAIVPLTIMVIWFMLFYYYKML